MTLQRGNKQINTQRGLENALIRSSIPHARSLSRWVFETLLPRMPYDVRSGTDLTECIVKDQVEVETGLKFEGSVYSKFIGLLVRKKVLVQKTNPVTKSWSPEFSLGQVGLKLAQMYGKIDQHDDRLAVLESDVKVLKSQMERVCEVVGVTPDPPNYDNLFNHYKKKDVQ